jgi:hypothetical protein
MDVTTFAKKRVSEVHVQQSHQGPEPHSVLREPFQSKGVKRTSRAFVKKEAHIHVASRYTCSRATRALNCTACSRATRALNHTVYLAHKCKKNGCRMDVTTFVKKEVSEVHVQQSHQGPEPHSMQQSHQGPEPHSVPRERMQ